ncbi:MAG: serine/threonine protein kinase, partial [Planctomycetes bacterium]|nr:serine/threonine protein kinase [Planctomycetota bacterium]
WIATQYVEGPSLRDHLQHRGPLLPRAAAELVRQLADSLHFAHERGLVHRDVKPSNIVLGDTGPVLLDLGLAHDERGALPSIARGQVCGTPDYMAPEQIEPEQTEPGQIEPAPIDRRVDVWALGVVLLECLTGELPFAAPSRAGVLYAVLHRDPVLPAGLDRRLAAVVRTALTRDRDRRYATAAALATDLQHHLAGEPVSALLPGPLERAGQWLRRHAVVAAVVAGLLLALAVGLATALTFLARESGLRRRSELAFADVRAMARTLAFDVHDALRGVAGATAARHLVIARASELFDRLALESAGDPTLAIELVRSLTRLGDVLGHEATDNLGAVAESRAAYARAAAIAERCWQDGPASEAECDALLVAFLKVADSLARVDTTAAVAAYDRVFTRLDAADAWFPSASRRRAMRAAAELNRGSLAQAIDERDVAASYFLRASTTLRELTRDDAGRREHGDLFASTLVALGRALARLERADDGIAVLREALAVARDARFAVTGGVHSTCCLVLGTILAVGEEPQQGEALLAETIALREDLCRQNGENFSAALQLASAHFERGLLIEKTLAADLAAGLGLCERLAAERPDHPIVLLQTARLRLLAAAA